MLSETQRQVLKQIIQTLKENNIQFQITGGLAAIIYGAKRPLFDVDLDVRKKDIEKVRKLFKEYIFEDFHNHQGKYFDIWIMTLKIDGVIVDISQGEDCSIFDVEGKKIKMDTDLSHPTMINFEGIELPVEPKDELIYYKKVIGRDTDLIDIEQITNQGS